MSNKILQLAVRTSSGVFIVLIVVLSRLIGLLEPLELFYFDLLLKARRTEPQDNRIVLIEIDSVEPLIGNNSKLSAKKLVNLITQLQVYQPSVIGFNVLGDLVDEADPSFKELSELISQQDNIISAESFIPPFIYPLSDTNPEKVGFVNLFPDRDNSVRRMLLGSSDFQDPEQFKFSFSLLLAKYYLEKQGYVLENGKIDQAAMRFGDTEIPQVYPNTGGYNHIDDAGVQTVVNYRKAQNPFKVVHFKNLSTELNFQLLKDKIVIIGITDSNKRAYTKTPVDAQMNGLQMTAHFTSQITSAVLDDRSLIQSWREIYEYIFIFIFGFLTIYLWNINISRQYLLITHITIGFSICMFAYIAFLVYGLWIVVMPLIIILFLNFFFLLFVKVYLSHKGLIERNKTRREVLERTFTRLHNGPLQEISIALNTLRISSEQNFKIIKKLEKLNQDIREIATPLEKESLIYDQSLYLINGKALDLNQKLHSLLHQIYTKTLNREFPNFKELKIKIRSFDEFPLENIKFEIKRDICRYLEEAICNVGNHAENVTCLIVKGEYSDEKYTLVIEDNGKFNHQKRHLGRGTIQAKILANKLNGSFERSHGKSKGTICKLSWRADNKQNIFKVLPILLNLVVSKILFSR